MGTTNAALSYRRFTQANLPSRITSFNQPSTNYIPVKQSFSQPPTPTAFSPSHVSFSQQSPSAHIPVQLSYSQQSNPIPYSPSRVSFTQQSLSHSPVKFSFSRAAPPPIPYPPSLSPNSCDSQTVSLNSETIGKVKWDEYPLKKGDSLSESVEVKPPPDPLWKRTVKLLKILLPHVGLNVLLLSYIAFGALVFIWLEADNELQNRRAKLQNVLKVYGMIMNETYQICAHEFNVTNSQAMIERRLRPLLSVLSRAHEYDDRFTLTGQLWTDSEEQMVTRWSFAAAVLYALTVITSTGYDHVTPSTDPGRIFTVFFGLVGIPLMFITAADIGKFLSEIVIQSYGKLLQLFAWIGSIVDAMREYINDEDDDSIDSRKRRRARRANILDEEEDDDDRLQLPIASYFALIIGYCAIGSFLFNTFEKGPIWSFMHGLFFSFNTITTIGLGNIYVRNQFYLALIVAYVIIGLAVITASLDLCSSTLKRTFTKLHYFGRKIRGARKGFANMSDDIREAMRIIAALKKTRPSKERITLEDLKRFLEVQEHLIRQPYVPYNVHIFRWIEDAYAQYFDEAGVMSDREKICTSEPILFF